MTPELLPLIHDIKFETELLNEPTASDIAIFITFRYHHYDNKYNVKVILIYIYVFPLFKP